MLSLIRLLALGLWVGAMAGFAFIFAPIAFHAIGPTPQFAAMIAATIGAITSFGYGCAAVAALATLPTIGAHPRRSGSVLVLLVLMTVLGFYETHTIVPLMQSTPLQTPAYDALHQRSSSIYSVILLAGVAAFIVSATTPKPSSR
ncbi:MAG: DUF4149 domain-containing protein [Vulcanimicrobiaceae bacterium]